MVFDAKPLTLLAKVMSFLMRPMMKMVLKECSKDLDDLTSETGADYLKSLGVDGSDAKLREGLREMQAGFRRNKKGMKNCFPMPWQPWWKRRTGPWGFTPIRSRSWGPWHCTRATSPRWQPGKARA